jgi:hypothetical protein
VIVGYFMASVGIAMVVGFMLRIRDRRHEPARPEDISAMMVAIFCFSFGLGIITGIKIA